MTDISKRVIKEQQETIDNLKRELKKKKHGYDDLMIKYIGVCKDLERLEKKSQREREQLEQAIKLHADYGIELKSRINELEEEIERLNSNRYEGKRP